MASRPSELLQRHVPFDRLTPEQLAWLDEHLEARSYKRGDALLLPGIQPQRMIFIVRGVVHLEAVGRSSEKVRVLAEIIEGEAFPLEALWEERPVFSTFRAYTDLDSYELGLADFQTLCRQSPAFDEFCQQRASAFFAQSRRVYLTHFASGAPATHLASPLRGLIQRPPAVCLDADPLAQVLERMQQDRLQTVAVLDPAGRPVGLFALTDLLAAWNAGRAGPTTPIGELMSNDVIQLSADALGYEAALRMAERGQDHVLVMDGERLAAIVAERDLFALQRVGISELAVFIRSVRDEAGLVARAADIQTLARNLLEQGVAPTYLTRIVSKLNARLAERAIDLELPRHDLADVRFCWLALGSEGRLEQTLFTDQDNAIIFAVGGDGGDHDDGDGEATTTALRARLLPFAQRVNATLAQCGFTLCKGGIMAGNAPCCLSLSEWKARFSKWMREPDPTALLNATIYFDLRPQWGDTELGTELQQWLLDGVRDNARLLHLMAENALQRDPPVGFFRDFVVDRNPEHPDTIDLKVAGVTLFVDAARVFGLAYGVDDSSTEFRLRTAAARAGLGEADVDAWIDAFNFVQTLRLRRQHELAARGEPVHNRINPYSLNPLDRKFLLEAFRQAGLLQKQLSARFLARA